MVFTTLGEEQMVVNTCSRATAFVFNYIIGFLSFFMDTDCDCTLVGVCDITNCSHSQKV